MTIRLAAVISHPIQHYVPLFRRLAKCPDLNVKVFYCCDWGVRDYHDPGFNCNFSWDVSLLDGYEHEFLPNGRRPRSMSFWEVDNPLVNQYLDKFRPHLVYLHGYGHRTCWRAANWARGRAALLHFGDSELVHSRSWGRRLLKQAILRWHFRRCDAFLTVGDNNEKYYRHYGVPQEKLFRGAIPIDLARFQATLKHQDRPSRIEMRERFGLPGQGLLALLVGKLEGRKRPGDFVEALSRLENQSAAVCGLLVGDGPLRPKLERQIAQLGLSAKVKITGFINQATIPLVLDAGDILVTTSDFDPHPLVVTEGLVMGLPVIASDKVGCIGPSDSVRPGFNALIYKCGEVDELAQAIHKLVIDDSLRNRLSRGSRDLLQTQDVDVAVKGVLQAIEYLRPRWATRWSFLDKEAVPAC